MVNGPQLALPICKTTDLPKFSTPLAKFTPHNFSHVLHVKAHQNRFN